jgi:biotin synthase
MRGANIVMPNLTPPQYRVMYEIYPNKACINETSEACASCLSIRILNIGRTVGNGQGPKTETQYATTLTTDMQKHVNWHECFLI